ncbi:hypothetical protein Scep_016387 [Stephania cephalantha]|uniref:Uncharacterized protein n=1 Tax=Stephania cephalantha TaxID=152367 RepID=A0AAP0IMJ1_9MAGN
MADEGNPKDLANLLAHEREMRELMETKITHQEDNVSQMLELLQMHVTQYNQDRANVAPAIQVEMEAKLVNRQETAPVGTLVAPIAPAAPVMTDEPDATTASGAVQRSDKSGRRAIAWMAVIARSGATTRATQREAGGARRAPLDGGIADPTKSAANLEHHDAEAWSSGSRVAAEVAARRESAPRQRRRSDGGGGGSRMARGGSNERVGSISRWRARAAR